MKRILCLFLCLFLLSGTLFSQDIAIKWSDFTRYDKVNGAYDFTYSDVGKYIYTAFDIGKGRRIVAFDPTTLKQVAFLNWSGTKDALNKAEIYDGYSLVRVIPTKENVLLFLQKDGKGDIETTAVLELTPELKPVGKLQELHQVMTNMKKGGSTYTRIMKNSSLGNFLILNENRGPEGNIQLKYKLLNANFEVMDIGQVDFPFLWDDKNPSAYSGREYQWTDDNYLVIKSNTKEEVPNAPKRKRWLYYKTFTMVSLADGSSNNFTLKSDERKYSGINFETKNGTAYISGFYSNTNEEGENPMINGFFTTTIDLKKGEFGQGTNFDFNEEFLSNFKNNEKAAESGRKAKKEERRAKYLIDDMTIEEIITVGNKTKVICSVMNNITNTVCNSKGQCRTYYYCVKRGVVTFVLNSKMEVEKYDVLPRVALYNGMHNVYDVQSVALSNNQRLVVYGANAESKDGDIGGVPRFKDKDLAKTEFEYAILNSEGELERRTLRLNDINTKDENLYVITPGEILEYNGKLYVFSNFRKKKKGQLAIGIIEEK